MLLGQESNKHFCTIMNLLSINGWQSVITSYFCRCCSHCSAGHHSWVCTRATACVPEHPAHTAELPDESRVKSQGSVQPTCGEAVGVPHATSTLWQCALRCSALPRVNATPPVTPVQPVCTTPVHIKSHQPDIITRSDPCIIMVCVSSRTVPARSRPWSQPRQPKVVLHMAEPSTHS